MWTKLIVLGILILTGITVFIYLKISDFISRIKHRKLIKKRRQDSVDHFFNNWAADNTTDETETYQYSKKTDFTIQVQKNKSLIKFGR